MGRFISGGEGMTTEVKVPRLLRVREVEKLTGSSAGGSTNSSNAGKGRRT